MSDGAHDHLCGWIKAGMPNSSHRNFKEKCAICGHYSRTPTGNWTVCDETGERHKKEPRQ